jgi:two-component system cell cycle response regulator
MARARVLAVDDQRYFRELLAGMLDEEGYEAQTAATGEEALHILEHSRFDIVLTDLVMPGMDGSELVHRIKERDPEQDVVVVTGVVDVKTAVDAMKLGANEYLLKPFDRKTLSMALEGILQNRRLKAEHARLLEENIEYIGERSLYERALSIFSTLAVEPLAVRVVEALCHETRAQGGVMWVVGEGREGELDLAAARGLVRMADERETLPVSELPEALRGGARAAVLPWGPDEGPPALYATIQVDGRVAGLVRLTDKLEGEHFDAVDQAAAERFARFADTALTNALRVRWLERRSLRDPETGSYNLDYFQDVARNEIEKASRFGRTLALLVLDLGPPGSLRGLDGGRPGSWLSAVGEVLRGLLRATDVLAADGASRFFALLPEADALGAAVLKRRLRRALETGDLLTSIDPKARPRPHVGVALYPGDGAHLEPLMHALDRALEQERSSEAVSLGLERLSLSAALQALVRQGTPERPQMAEGIVRFVLGEVARRSRERGVLFAVPGVALAGAVQQGLESLEGVSASTELVVISEGDAPGAAPEELCWVSSKQVPGLPPCLIHYGDGPVYALIREEAHGDAEGRLFHTSDRVLVEHLAFRLQEELAVPASIGDERRA